MKPVLLIILDGAGDRQQPELGGLTPLAAVRTPNLDALAGCGSTGIMAPLSPGRAPTSPLSHFVLFGYEAREFPGRGLVEALGEGVRPTAGSVVCRANFVRTEARDGALWITERGDPRAGEPVNDDVDLDWEVTGVRCTFTHTSGAQGILTLSPGPGVALSPQVTDSDPLRPDTFARRVMPFAEATDPTAAELTASVLLAWMQESRRRLHKRPMNTALVKWAASAPPLATFTERTGLRGGTLARGALYRGLGAAIGLDVLDAPQEADKAAAFAHDLGRGIDLLDAAYDFVHVHTKWPDDAGHAKSPQRKREVLEVLDTCFAPHLDRLTSGDFVVCVTADHQTPCSGPLYHSGGPVPILICGGAAGRDEVTAFNEADCLHGSMGRIEGRDLMPLLLDAADRSAFLGAERYTAQRCLGTPSGETIVPLRAD